MRCQPGSHDGPRNSGRPLRLSPGLSLWCRLIKPALLIALLGAMAVLHLLACARLSVVECDRQRLRRIAADDDARRVQLCRRLTEHRSAEFILRHAKERGLEKPAAVVHITVDEVPQPLWADIPREAPQAAGSAFRLGQLSTQAESTIIPPPRALQ